MIHLPLFGCNISLQSFLLLQFQFHSNFRRSNEKATAAAINPDSDDNSISLGQDFTKNSQRHLSPKANFTGISLTDTPAKGALSCKP